MRKHYVDNIRWITVLLVVLYHVIFMYNGVASAGVIGAFSDTQYQDVIQYMLYPWFMVILFVVSGISTRYYLETHTIKEFAKSRTRKLLVPSTIGLFIFQWIQGYYNMAISHAFESMPAEMPKFILYFIMIASGIGVLWYIQVLWIFSMGIVLVRKFETGKLFAFCERTNVGVMIILGVFVWICAQFLNTPIITVYRFGIYGFCFLLGYFVFAHESVIDHLSKYWHILSGIAILLCISYCYYYFGQNYAIEPVVNSPFSITYGWLAVLAIFAVMKKWGNFSNAFTTRMSKNSFGLYVFHYLPLTIVAYYMKCFTSIPALPSYFIAGVASYVGGLLLYKIISNIPFLRWCVLGIKK